MNKNTLNPFDREAKAILLNALKRGYFENKENAILAEKGVIETIRSNNVPFSTEDAQRLKKELETLYTGDNENTD